MLTIGPYAVVVCLSALRTLIELSPAWVITLAKTLMVLGHVVNIQLGISVCLSGEKYHFIEFRQSIHTVGVQWAVVCPFARLSVMACVQIFVLCQ